MTERYFLSPAARRDIRQITLYIKQHNPAAAIGMHERFMQAIRQLAETPLIGQRRDDLTDKPVRFWPVHPNYMIIYEAETYPVRILRVYHVARKVERLGL